MNQKTHPMTIAFVRARWHADIVDQSRVSFIAEMDERTKPPRLLRLLMCLALMRFRYWQNVWRDRQLRRYRWCCSCGGRRHLSSRFCRLRRRPGYDAGTIRDRRANSVSFADAASSSRNHRASGLFPRAL